MRKNYVAIVITFETVVVSVIAGVDPTKRFFLCFFSLALS